MKLYAWVTPAFISKGSPVDHTWVTSYDSQSVIYSDIASIVNANHSFWYCWGSFHTKGKPTLPISTVVTAHSAALCLVDPNNPNSHGTIQWYGIDGVCHQVANQVLYATSDSKTGKPKTVSGARGYKLSSAIFGTYGRREQLWRQARIRCRIAPSSVWEGKASVSILCQRLTWNLKCRVNDEPVKTLEIERRNLLMEIDRIGFSSKASANDVNSIVDQLNKRINRYLGFAREHLNNEDVFRRVFGLNSKEWIDLIDPQLFVIPDSSAPERNSINGW